MRTRALTFVQLVEAIGAADAARADVRGTHTVTIGSAARVRITKVDRDEFEYETVADEELLKEIDSGCE